MRRRRGPLDGEDGAPAEGRPSGGTSEKVMGCTRYQRVVFLWIDRERVERDHQRAEAAERRIRLGVELLGEGEVAGHGASGQRLGEDPLALGRREGDRVVG